MPTSTMPLAAAASTRSPRPRCNPSSTAGRRRWRRPLSAVWRPCSGPSAGTPSTPSWWPARPRRDSACPALALSRPTLSADDLDRLADALGSWAPMMWVGVLGGLRWADGAGLTIGYLDLLAGTVTVSQQLGRDLKLGPPKSASPVGAGLHFQSGGGRPRGPPGPPGPDRSRPRCARLLRTQWANRCAIRTGCAGPGARRARRRASRPCASMTSARWRPPPSWLPASTSGPPKPGWATPRRPLHSPSMHVRQPRLTVEKPMLFGRAYGGVRGT